jgi:hypothetical protein
MYFTKLQITLPSASTEVRAFSNTRTSETKA